MEPTGVAKWLGQGPVLDPSMALEGSVPSFWMKVYSSP